MLTHKKCILILCYDSVIIRNVEREISLPLLPYTSMTLLCASIIYSLFSCKQLHTYLGFHKANKDERHNIWVTTCKVQRELQAEKTIFLIRRILSLFFLWNFFFTNLGQKTVGKCKKWRKKVKEIGQNILSLFIFQIITPVSVYIRVCKFYSFWFRLVNFTLIFLSTSSLSVECD